MPAPARPRAPRALALLAVLPFALGVGFLLLGTAQHRAADPFRDGTTAFATVVTAAGGGRYALAVPGGAVVPGVHSARPLAAGQRLRVSYPPGQPQRMRPASGSMAWMVDLICAWVFVGLGLVAAAVTLLSRPRPRVVVLAT